METPYPLLSIPPHNLKQILNQMEFKDFINLNRSNHQLLLFIDDNKEIFNPSLNARKLYIHCDGRMNSLSPYLEFSEGNINDLVNIHTDELYLKEVMGPEGREMAMEACKMRKVKAKHVIFHCSDFIPEILLITGATGCSIGGGNGKPTIEDHHVIPKLDSLHLIDTLPLNETQLHSLTCKRANFTYERILEKDVNLILKRFLAAELKISKWEFRSKNNRPTAIDLDLLTTDLDQFLTPLWCPGSHSQSLLFNHSIEEINPRVRALFSLKNNQNPRIVVRIDDSSITLLEWPEAAGEEFLWNIVRLFK